ncbi:MAG: beta-lactamase family protein [Phycisphaerae bacterium]|nr:beta-lactamase family protein [Phycisphaerae bacterium]
MGSRQKTTYLLRRTLSAIVVFFILGTISKTIAPAFPATDRPQLNEEQLAPVSGIVERTIRDGKILGAVVLIGNREKVIYRRAFGYRSLNPEKILMTADTIFDLASLTKVVATTTAVMQLVETGKLRLDDPVARYWPAFKAHRKGYITVRELLTHYSGLRPDLNLKPGWSGYKTAMKKIVAERPLYPPGKVYVYSDINFDILGELVRRVSGKALDEYCSMCIFNPLGIKDTRFKPPADMHERIAPTQYHKRKMLCGYVHDPTCYNMGGVSGHAGLFSTADDLSIFAQMLLNKGSMKEVKILKPQTVEQMIMPQSPLNKPKLRGLGWDIEAPLSSNRDELFPVGSYGHLGYTGTSIWIDPVTETYIIVLTNRVYPDGKGDVTELRALIKAAVAEALGPISHEQILLKLPALTTYYEHIKN